MIKRIITLAASFFIVFSFFAGCGAETSPAVTETTDNKGNEDMKPYEWTTQEAENINCGSKLGIDFLGRLGLPEDEAKKYNEDQPKMKTTDDGTVSGYYFSYPYGSNDQRLTEIQIDAAGYDFYGIGVGDDIASVAEVMSEKGYKQAKNLYVFDGTNTQTYHKHHISVVFETKSDSTEIVTIYISAVDPKKPEVMR